MKKTKEGKIILTYKEAIKRLKKRGRIHTFRNTANMLIGADWDRIDLLYALKKAKEIHQSGEQAKGMGHGLAIMNNESWLFIETKKCGVK